MFNQTIQRLLHRPDNANKYDFGHVLIIGGSPGAIGAPLLAAMAALRTGAGLVTIAAYTEVIDKLEKRVLEAMTLRLPHNDHAAIQTIHEFIAAKKVSVVVIGPGLLPPATVLSMQLVPTLTVPVVLDAGALTCFRSNLATLEAAGAQNPSIIATPHDGEYHQLTGLVLPTKISARRHAATEFAKRMHLTLVCKGHHTIVAHQDGTAHQDHRGNPGMAKAGTGDVLSGIIAGLLAQDVLAAEAADLGVHLHALAGDLAVASKTQAGVIASDLIDSVPQAMRAASDSANN
jgi:NAD(P)H-hydrate epimerase